MSNPQTCLICKAPNTTRSGAGTNTAEHHCPRCGRYLIQMLAETQLANAHPAFPPMHLLSGLCRNMWDILGEKAAITVDTFKSWAEFDKIAKIAIPRDTDLVTKGEYIMKYIRRKSKTLADAVPFSPNELAVGFCANKSEFLFCLRYLSEKGWVEEDTSRKQQQPGTFAYRLTPAGWWMLDKADVERVAPAAVVAFGPDKDGDMVWTQGFAAALTAAGLTPVKAETKEAAGKITDDVLVELRRAVCVVADLTGQHAGAYFQAAFAMGLGKPVFWTCEASEISEKKLLIDTRQQVITPWTRDKLPEFARRLAARIGAAMV
ncbi:MAG: hypothetical protein FWH21_03915 [Kiritimatiellaeota bacterium]|nr:hypothetical protein [Kiritimatiellota bacterium]